MGTSRLASTLLLGDLKTYLQARLLMKCLNLASWTKGTLCIDSVVIYAFDMCRIQVQLTSLLRACQIYVLSYGGHMFAVFLVTSALEQHVIELSRYKQMVWRCHLRHNFCDATSLISEQSLR